MIAATDRLDRFWADELGCTPEALYADGVTTCSPPHRSGPRWMGWLVPLECVVTDRAPADTGVISITPNLADDLLSYLPTCTEGYLPPSGRAMTPFLRAHFPHATPKIHRILGCPATRFTPAPAPLPISLLDDDDIHASWYRLHFDGPIFVARNERGSIVSWAAVKCKSFDVWEMAVVTEPQYRGRGLARSVVSRATMAALDAGKVPMYLHELSNQSSAKVCGSLGYEPYGYELTCESGRVTSRRSR